MPYGLRGLAYYENGDYDSAIADHTEAMRRASQDDAADYYNRGLAYYENGGYEEAIADYTEAIRLDPRDVEAHRELGKTYEALGKLDEAAADYEEFNNLTNSGKTEGNEEETDNDKDQVVVDTVDMLRGMMPDDEFEKMKERVIRNKYRSQ